MSRRPVRLREPRGASLQGRVYDVDVGPVAHGGHCVARIPADVPEVGGTVVFVRHALPGETVSVRVTEGVLGDRFLRGDAVAVHRPSPDRVPPPCPFSGPGRCGGCDFQHVALPAQRTLKAQVVEEQLRRLAGVERAVEVEAVPGDEDGLHWRTRMRFHRGADGRLGLRAHRSDSVVPVTGCLIQAPEARVVVEGETAPGEPVLEDVSGHAFRVEADGFWQVHRGAPRTLVEAVLAAAEVATGDRVLDLYSGVGLFTAFLAEEVGPSGDVVSVEGDRRAAAHAEHNVAAYPWVRVVTGPAGRVLTDPRVGARDVVVLDPPREGAKRTVVAGVAATGARRVVYVACDPAALARDVAYFAEHGYELGPLRAFDLFPMTHHVECVALLERVGSDLR